MMAQGTYRRLFSPVRIGSVEIENRVAMTPMGVNLAAAGGGVNDDIIAFYEARARGGIGLIISEICRVMDGAGAGEPCQLAARGGADLQGLERLVDAVHKYDTRMFIQLHHPGRQGSVLCGGEQPVSASVLSHCGVFIACGARPFTPPVPGIEGNNVCVAEDVLLGCTVVDMLPEIGAGANAAVILDLKQRMAPFNPTYLPGHRLSAITTESVELECLESGQWVRVAADTVILALEVRPQNGVVEGFKSAFPDAHVIGDAVRGGRIVDATQCAYGQAFVYEYAAQLVGRQRLTEAASGAALARVRFDTRPEAAAEADLLSESVPEDPDLKGRVFAQFNAICPPRTIFTTDTSTLLPSVYASATGRPEQFAAFHFHTYVWDWNLVDVMPHPGTSPEVVELLRKFARRIGQIPLVLKKESPGYVMNAILGVINDKSFRLVQDGVASVEDVDRAVMIVMRQASGPFGSLDIVGLDTVWHIMQSNARMSGDAEAQAAADRFRAQYIDKGWLGVKSGRGFHAYPHPAYARPGFLTGEVEQP